MASVRGRKIAVVPDGFFDGTVTVGSTDVVHPDYDTVDYACDLCGADLMQALDGDPASVPRLENE